MTATQVIENDDAGPGEPVLGLSSSPSSQRQSVVHFESSFDSQPDAQGSGSSNAMSEFKDLCRKNGLETFSRTENSDDATILRFLKAQQFDVKASFEQFHHFQTWRRENNIRGFYKSLDVDVYDETRKMVGISDYMKASRSGFFANTLKYPQWIGRRDHDGRPIYVFQVRKLNKKSLDGYLKFLAKTQSPGPHADSNIPVHILHLHALYENLLQFVFPLLSELPQPDSKQTISSSTHIVDISNVSVFQFWNIRKYLQEASKIATAHYPETLGKVFVIGAPAFFKSVWEAISQWFDLATRSKIFVLSASETKSFLLSNIAASDLPKEYGGELEWKWQDQPNLDESTRHLVDEVYHKTERGEVFSKGPLFFQNGCIQLVGSLGGLPRRNAFCRLNTPPHVE
ncbi:CRAL/TRIO domain-containing protein [Penicillium longicatenatum]|uniref:CRAL/TRIO domain-containing protein n=1 Tax=Penicillium longicatenatum TaxID=1561947 RepID=UPI002547FBC9|nr:CRAL/TRIO domain-containing protein [Penicillium longicatenatum]KAJ5635465.1 CRAL/TRIO domain-containing protein [Penicillium longicatenatum]